jgi:ABC-type bacteriocin/lantibiotic exporter with double-glycine peptidase domain
LTTSSIGEAVSRRLPPPGRLTRLWPRVRPYRWKLALATVALVASGLLALAFPMAVRYLLDAAFVERNRALLDRIAIGLVVLFSVRASEGAVRPAAGDAPRLLRRAAHR